VYLYLLQNRVSWDEYEQGLVLGSPYWLYWATQLPSSMVAHRYGSKIVFGLSNYIMCMLGVLIPFATFNNFYLLIAIRVLQGVIGGFVWPVLHAITAAWVPPNERSKFITAYTGSSLGSAITFPLCGQLIHWFGWQSVFYATGVLGTVWFIAWWLLMFDSPEKHPRISITERDYIIAEIGKTKSKPFHSGKRFRWQILELNGELHTQPQNSSASSGLSSWLPSWWRPLRAALLVMKPEIKREVSHGTAAMPPSWWHAGSAAVVISALRNMSYEAVLLCHTYVHVMFQYPQIPTPWIKMLTSVPVWLVIFTQWGNLWCLYTVFTQAPTYLYYIHGWDIQMTGILSGLPHIMRVVFAFVMSIICDYLLRTNKMSRTSVRKLAIAVCELGCLGQCVFNLGLAFSGCNSIIAILCMILATACTGVDTSGQLASMVDLSPNFASFIMGISNTISVMTGFLTPLVVGFLTFQNQTSSAWQMVYLVSALMVLVPDIFHLIFGTSEVQEWNYPVKSATQLEEIAREKEKLNPNFEESDKNNTRVLSYDRSSPFVSEVSIVGLLVNRKVWLESILERLESSEWNRPHVAVSWVNMMVRSVSTLESFALLMGSPESTEGSWASKRNLSANKRVSPQ
ncbi:unnamed protein product, partial [Timema podura]|nr:unnamed protein product [Timema podura]